MQQTLKKQKNFWITFILLISVSFILMIANACIKEQRRIKLEIKDKTVGSVAYTGGVLFFRMYNNQEVEFDLVCNVEYPQSESDLVRKKTIISEQDAEEIQSIIMELENSDLKKSYPPLPSNQPATDVWYHTEVTFTNEKGENMSIKIPLERRRIIAPAYEQMYPKPLIKLLKKVTDMRTACSD